MELQGLGRPAVLRAVVAVEVAVVAVALANEIAYTNSI
jgi:hypothetical protein